jgi:hypothetical protein
LDRLLCGSSSQAKLRRDEICLHGVMLPPRAKRIFDCVRYGAVARTTHRHSQLLYAAKGVVLFRTSRDNLELEGPELRLEREFAQGLDNDSRDAFKGAMNLDCATCAKTPTKS